MSTPRRVHAVALAAVLLALAAHFGITLLYLTPATPLRQALAGPVEGYMAPFFEQKWELFAPAPVKNSRVLLIACRAVDAPPDQEPVWHDVTRPLLDDKYATRVTPADRLHRAVQAGTSLIFHPPQPLIDKMRARPDLFQAELANVAARDSSRFGLGQRLITRLASAHCDQLLGPGRTAAVRGRVLLVEPPAFSKRRDDDRQGTAQVIDLDWQTYQTVARL